MSLNIKNADTHQLVQELAALTGETQTTAVTITVRERLDRIRHLRQDGLADRLLAIGQDTAPRLSPDGRSLLYWDVPGSGKSAPMQLMRIPVSGGVPEKVLQARHGAIVHCSPNRTACVLGEPDQANGELVFTSFDPATGRTSELIRVAADLSLPPAWDLSPDGSSVAIVGLDEQRDHVRVIELDSGSARTITVGHSAQLQAISWSADGKGWFLSSSSLREAALLYVSLTGSFSELWTTSTAVGAPLASPDGRNIAFTVSASNSNAWMVENF